VARRLPRVSAADVDAYLAGVAEAQRAALAVLRATLIDLVPDGEECMSYAMPCVKVSGKAIAGYAAFTRHNSYFPHSGRVLPELAATSPDALTGYDWEGGTLRFGPTSVLPESLVAHLVRIRRLHLNL
jgi:uncharacterized protein YdhG (YjbR/CyaY superfamily)